MENNITTLRSAILAALLLSLSLTGWSRPLSVAQVALTLDTKVLGTGHRNLPGLKLNGVLVPMTPITQGFPNGTSVNLEAPTQLVPLPNEVCLFQFWHVSDTSGGRYFNTNVITLTHNADTTAVAWYSCFSTFGMELNVDAWSFELGSSIPGGVTMTVIPPNTSQRTFFTTPAPGGVVTLITPAQWPVVNPTFILSNWAVQGAMIVSQSPDRTQIQLRLSSMFATAIAWYETLTSGQDCDPGPPQAGQYLRPGGSFYATGGTDSNHDYKGVDSFAPANGNVAPWRAPKAGAAYSAAMWHTGDWAVYHFRVSPLGLEQIDLCLGNPLTPAVGTPVEIYVSAPGSPALPPSHDSDLATSQGWILVGSVTIMPPGNPQVYSLNVSIPPATEYSVAVRLRDGELGPDPGKDRNVTISWIKLRNF